LTAPAKPTKNAESKSRPPNATAEKPERARPSNGPSSTTQTTEKDVKSSLHDLIEKELEALGLEPDEDPVKAKKQQLHTHKQVHAKKAQSSETASEDEHESEQLSNAKTVKYNRPTGYKSPEKRSTKSFLPAIITQDQGENVSTSPAKSKTPQKSARALQSSGSKLPQISSSDATDDAVSVASSTSKSSKSGKRKAIDQELDGSLSQSALNILESNIKINNLEALEGMTGLFTIDSYHLNTFLLFSSPRSPPGYSGKTQKKGSRVGAVAAASTTGK
jgi:hypothetical protein